MNDKIVYTNYHHADVDKYIAEWKTNTNAMVALKSKTNAGKKLPKASGDEFIRYIGFFKEVTASAIKDVDRILKVVPVLFSINQMKHKRDIIVFKLQSKKEELESKLLQLNPHANNSENKLVRIGSVFLLALLFLLALAEATLSFRPFLYITGNRQASSIIALVFGVIWTIGAEKFASYWNQGEGIKRTCKRIALLIGCTFVFFAIAHLRAIERACSNAILNDEPIPHFLYVNYFEVIVLTCVGWLFFCGGVFIAQRSPSLLSIKQAITQKINKWTARKVEKEILNLQKQIDEANDKIIREEHAGVSLLNIRKQAIKEVEGHLNYLAEFYKEVNYSCRVDCVYPDCFNTPMHFDMNTMIPNIKEDLDNLLNNSTI